ncbi:basal cell adhesion molecule-like isoform X2 [Hyperolius riggenbachi]|uniref:basal cell adhesion molecule-like isoform X2 n=1 Tax=Hyperolius riggenbachi TaxID=752182 RepID=UPI0035A3D1BF
MESRGFLSLLCVVLSLASHTAHARLYISGPQSPVLEGEDVLLECLSDSETDMRNYTFQKYSTWMKSWIQLDVGRFMRCWYFAVNISRNDDRLLLHLSDISEWQNGPYRCVGTGNQTTDTDVSENITIPVIYLQDIYLQKMHSWYTSMSDVLWAEEGSTVEVKCTASSSQDPYYEWSQQDSDWILPSDTLTLRNIDKGSEGTYVCQARHPDMYSLVKTRSFQLRVSPMPEMVACFSGYMSLENIVLYIALPAAMLLILIFTFLFIILRHRKRQMKKPQISLIDGEKRTPIYKGSLQSMSSSTSDTQPLVM